MHDTRGARASVTAGLLCLIVLVAYAGSVSAGRLTHGFVSYHTAAQVLLVGHMGPQVYDSAWFGQQVQRRTATDVREIFVPNPPTMALLALPGRPVRRENRARSLAARVIGRTRDNYRATRA